MIEAELELDVPEDENTPIWRYVDFTKLVRMLDTRCLFFARTTTFKDPFEGSLPIKSLQMRNELVDWSLRGVHPEAEISIAQSKVRDAQMWQRQFVKINCWHINAGESAAMWSLYASRNKGVAIKSTYRKLVNSLGANEAIRVGRVRYIDYAEDAIPLEKMLPVFLCRRRSFDYEQELRAVLIDVPEMFDNLESCVNQMRPFVPPDNGQLVQTDLSTLIEELVVSPLAQHWFTELVRSVVQKYGLSTTVRASDLSRAPTY